ncbi:Nonribosomal peptide synthetase aclP [Colletotrichum trifolii]|uniref:Nonribosomal peptide synthetase aclP n=1 Tax=Colletotrichum trifolii TaxID=5466 RepID=A0A4R8RTN9_COLTR|nr:Nonribosomal peptide synthetase aclP [Colletotrichum trifolii]
MAISAVLPILADVLSVDVGSVRQDASFTSHGGDSMAALRFSMECRRRGLFVPVDVVLSSPSISGILQQCRQLEIPKATSANISGTDPGDELLIADNQPQRTKRSYTDCISNETNEARRNKRFRETSTKKSSCESLGPNSEASSDLRLLLLDTEDLCGDSNTIHELSDTQLSIIHGSSDENGANIIYYGETHDPDYIPHLKEAWPRVLRAEPIFRARYRIPEDGSAINCRLHWREYSTRNRDVYQTALRAAAGPGLTWPDSNASGIDFGLRFTALHYQGPNPVESESTLIWGVHHALVDGWSAGLVVRKVHLAASGGITQPGPSYADVLKAQDQLSLTRWVEGDLFWSQQRTKLSAARDELLIERRDTEDGGQSTLEPGHVGITLSTDEHAFLKSAAQVCSVTPAAFFHAAWAVCLGLYTDSDNVVMGAVVSTRSLELPGMFETVGPMFNTLPLQIDLCWETSAGSFVKDIFARMQRLSRYSWTTPDNGFTRVGGNLIAMTPDEHTWAEHRTIGPSFCKYSTNVPLNAIVKDDGSSVDLQYSPSRYTPKSMEALAEILKGVLMSLCRTEASLKSSQVLPTKHREMLGRMGNWNTYTTTIPSIEDDLVTLFERTAMFHPEVTAIELGLRRTTYAELEMLSGQVAARLASIIQPQEVVAIHADASLNCIIGVYGILRAGGVYCSLDRAHPQDYRDSLFEASTARVFLATDAESVLKGPLTAKFALDIEKIVGKQRENPSAPFARRTTPRPQDKAYLCFTSGSTGKPKGVVCTHRGLVAFQSNLEVRLGAAVGTKIAQVMSVAFDGAIHEMFSALSYGATLVLRSRGEESGLDHLKAADSAILTPSLASVLDPDDFPRLQTVYLVGEIVPQTVCDTWASKKTLYNMYGPTEATCGATIKRLLPGKPVTIGGPNPTTRIYILDHLQHLAPPGRVGEIYLAGVQVAQGYIGRPDVTAERFLPDPFCGSPEFMYRTGDRGYWDEAGDIVFLGRTDRQIKLQGFRMDFEDLEARVLRACSKKHGARAVAFTNRGNDLVCMIQSSDTDVAAVRETLRASLPAFAVPRRVSVVSRLPMTPNLKVDYRSIADGAGNTVGEDVAIQSPSERALVTDTETAIANIWTQVLDMVSTTTQIGPESNFIQLGGHSLLQMRLASRLKAMFGTSITMRMIVDTPTLRHLATAIDKMEKQVNPLSSSTATATRLPGGGRAVRCTQYDIGPMEREWWHKAQLKCGTSAFNVSWVARYDGRIISKARMLEAWNTVLARHIIFRARYVQDAQHGLQRVLAVSPPRAEQRDWVDVRKELNRQFDLASADPVRVVMTHDTIVALWPHIICDYTALSIILNEVAAVYHQSAPLLLPPPAPQLCYQRAPSDAVCLDFWSRYLGDVKDAQHNYLSNGADRVSYEGRSLMGRVSTPLWRRMQKWVSLSGVTMQQLLVAAVAAALGAEDELVDLTLGIPYINRHSEADMEAVGLFLEPLPVRVRHDDSASSLASYVAGVQNSSQRALAHAVPWDQLLEHLGVDSTARLPNHPLFDCVASFHDARGRGSGRRGGGPWSKDAWGDGVEPQLVWSDGAKFKLMVECLAYDEDTLLLRLEYDTLCFGGVDAGDERRVAAVRRMILTAMDAIVSREECTLACLRQDLKALWSAETAFGFQAERGMDFCNHLLWKAMPKRDDDLVSWTSSLLFAIHFAIYRHTKRPVTNNDENMSNIFILMLDTRDFHQGTFVRDLDAIRYHLRSTFPEKPELEKFYELRRARGYYIGEYLTQGSLSVTGKCRQTSLERLTDSGLFYICPYFSDQSYWGMLNQRVAMIRQTFLSEKGKQMCLRPSEQTQLRRAITIAQACFGDKLALPFTLLLLSLSPAAYFSPGLFQSLASLFSDY